MVDTLAALLAHSHPHCTVERRALDRGEPLDDLRGAEVAVVTVSSQDPTFEAVRRRFPDATVVAVVWQPPDEIPRDLPVAAWVEAGRITQGLGAAVAAAHHCSGDLAAR